jgi:hypothetical protein
VLLALLMLLEPTPLLVDDSDDRTMSLDEDVDEEAQEPPLLFVLQSDAEWFAEDEEVITSDEDEDKFESANESSLAVWLVDVVVGGGGGGGGGSSAIGGGTGDGFKSDDDLLAKQLILLPLMQLSLSRFDLKLLSFMSRKSTFLFLILLLSTLLLDDEFSFRLEWCA